MTDSVKNLGGRDIDISDINDLWHVAEFLKGVEDNFKILSKITGKFIPYSEAVLEVWQQAAAMKHHINGCDKNCHKM